MSMKWMREHGGTWFVWNLVMATLSAATIISQPRVEVILQQRPRRGTSSANNMSMKWMRGYRWHEVRVELGGVHVECSADHFSTAC